MNNVNIFNFIVVLCFGLRVVIILVKRGCVMLYFKERVVINNVVI